MKKARFIFKGITAPIMNIDPSAPNVPIDKQWHELQQEIFDQLEDSKFFTSEELKEISELDTKDFLVAIREQDENNTGYNRARAIWEYTAELKSAKNKTKWAQGLDALKAGAPAEEYNY